MLKSGETSMEIHSVGLLLVYLYKCNNDIAQYVHKFISPPSANTKLKINEY